MPQMFEIKTMHVTPCDIGDICRIVAVKVSCWLIVCPEPVEGLLVGCQLLVASGEGQGTTDKGPIIIHQSAIGNAHAPLRPLLSTVC